MHIIAIIFDSYFLLCVLAKFYSKTIRCDFNHRKASSIDRDAITYLGLIGGLNIENVVLESFDFGDFTHQATEQYKIL